MKKFIILALCWATQAYSEEVFPPGCTPFVIDGDQIKTPTNDKPQLVMIHNLSNTDLWITHTVSNTTQNAGWSSHLQTGNWSALILQNKPYVLNCIESKPGHEQLVACSSVIGACQWPLKSHPEKIANVTWAGENMVLAPLTAYIGRRGFIVSSPAQ
jgi:hypothetical protein